ncbi:MAG: DUF2249 domain-containing protein [Dermatophilaceae bacterium]
MSTVVVATSAADAQAVEAVEAVKDHHAQLAGALAVQVEAPAEGGCGGECGCGEQDPVGVLPELDARAVPHAIRHATIFGALDSVGAGSGLVLLAPHDPLPLLMQLEQRSPGLFSVDYLKRGPETWRLRFVRA